MAETAAFAVTVSTLALLAIQDVREQKIYIAIPAAAGIIICAIKLHAGTGSVIDMAAGAAVGGMLIFVGFLCPSLLGTGDGIVFVMTGISSGLWGNLSLLWISSVLAGIYAAWLKLFCHKEKDYEFAFLPFVLGGYVICYIALR